MEHFFLSLIRGERRGLGPALLRGGLRLASIPYGCAMTCRNWLYDRAWKRSYPASVPVISVGNLTLGGTGKTPCVEYLARWFRQRDLRVAILSRGYGSDAGPNDEALVLEENLPDVPHLQGPDRLALAGIAVEELESQVLILDDGFQHRRLRRDLDVVLVDATAPWGHGYVFPRGLLREPAAGLRRAGLVCLTRCDQVDPEALRDIRQRIARVESRLQVLETCHRPADWINASGNIRPLAEIAEQPLAAFCGIGNPQAFRRTLEQLGGRIADWRTFPDHHPYTRSDVADLTQWANRQARECAVVTTQKDLVKLRVDRLADRPLWALRIELQVQAGREVLEEKLSSIVIGN